MAKRGTLTHRRTRRLAAALCIPLPCALGLMEALWHVTAEHAPAGDVGRMSDEDLCDELYWDQDPGELVEAFVRAGVLERHPDHRLVVHGWSEHADNALRHKLNRARSTFWDGELPFRRRPPTTEHDQTPSDHDEPPDDADRARQDEIEPASVQQPVPAPATSNQRPTETNPPLAPPASRVGTGAPGEVFRVGDKLGDGRIVLEVDDVGRVVVVSRGEGTAPTLAPDGREAVERIVAYASKALGHRFDRADRRRLRERLLGGESEAQILAGYRAQVEALEALEAAETPEEAEDAEYHQALRLAGAAPQDGLAAAGRSDP